MEIILIAQSKKDPPKLTNIPQPVIDLTHNETMTFCVVERGMQSGQHSVIIVSSDEDGSICLQTSLDKLITGVSGCAAIAEKQWGWVRPEGHFTMMPPSREAQKVMLEAIKKELEEWEETNEN